MYHVIMYAYMYVVKRMLLAVNIFRDKVLKPKNFVFKLSVFAHMYVCISVIYMSFC